MFPIFGWKLGFLSNLMWQPGSPILMLLVFAIAICRFHDLPELIPYILCCSSCVGPDICAQLAYTDHWMEIL